MSRKLLLADHRYPATGSLDLRALTAPQAPFFGWYFQDDFKVTAKLTLNLGLRYELLFGTTERYNQSNLGFDPNVSNPIEADAKAAYARSPIPELSPNDFKVRGAYRVLPRTVIRTGFGVFNSVWWQRLSARRVSPRIRRWSRRSMRVLRRPIRSVTRFPTGLFSPPGRPWA